MILTLAKNGTNFTHGNERSYDVWGTPSDNGDPAQRYCANLGHVTDDESGLIYMRARYYEPSTGRFLSEDPARDGWNWYVYCGNEPVGHVDPSGKWSDQDNALAFWAIGISLTVGALFVADKPGSAYYLAFAAVFCFMVCMEFASAWESALSPGIRFFTTPARLAAFTALEGTIVASLTSAKIAKRLPAGNIGILILIYAFICIGAMAASDFFVEGWSDGAF